MIDRNWEFFSSYEAKNRKCPALCDDIQLKIHHDGDNMYGRIKSVVRDGRAKRQCQPSHMPEQKVRALII